MCPSSFIFQSNLYSGKGVLVRPEFDENIFVGDIRFFTSRQGIEDRLETIPKNMNEKIISYFKTMTFACVGK